MDFTAAHIGFVLACYGISFACIMGLTIHVIGRDRKLRAEVRRLDAIRHKDRGMNEEPAKSGRRWLAAIPIVAFLILAAIFWRGLSGNPSEIPSALIGKPVPSFALPAVEGLGIPGFDAAALSDGQVTLVNIWASWCGPCRVEHPVLMDLSKRGDIRLYGLNYKDEAENARRFLGMLGQPYAAAVADESGRAAVDWGVYGVPETFIVDGQGVIRFKWIGPLTPEAVAGAFGAEIEKAKSAQP